MSAFSYGGLVHIVQWCHSSGVGNLRPAWTFNMTRNRIFVTQIRTEQRVKTELQDNPTVNQEKHLSLLDIVFSSYFPQEDQAIILRYNH